MSCRTFHRMRRSSRVLPIMWNWRTAVADEAKSPFEGDIGPTIRESKPWWPPQTKAPPDAANMLIVLFDDVGFSDFGCYGSPIKTPTIDHLAAKGLRYKFPHNGMCSTTRAALLTGVACGNGALAQQCRAGSAQPKLPH